MWTAVGIRRRITLLAKRPVNYSWTLAAWQGPFVLFVSYWILRPPPSEIAAAVFGLAAVFMALRTDAKWSRTEKVGWIIIVMILAMAWIRAVQHERDQHDSEQATLRADQDKHFEGMLAQNQRDFDATISRIQGLLAKEEAIAKTAKQSLDQITGGGQFCYLRVEEKVQGGYLLMPMNSGPIPLAQCYVAIHPNPGPGALGYPQANFQIILARELGPLPPGPSRSLIKVPIVVPAGPYFIDIFTRNQMFVEFLTINSDYPKNGKPLETIEVRGGKAGKLLYKDPP